MAPVSRLPGWAKNSEGRRVATILQRIADSDSTAVAECLDTYGGLVWSMVRRQALPPQDAEDAVQEIFIDVWKSAPRFDPAQASETTFICMIARRRLIDRRRRRQRQPPIDSLSANPQLQISSVDHRHLESNAEAALAGRVIANLKPKEREVLLLSAYQGMSHGQIAAHTGLPLGTVKTYVRRGLMRVRAMLDQSPPSAEKASA